MEQELVGEVRGALESLQTSVSERLSAMETLQKEHDKHLMKLQRPHAGVGSSDDPENLEHKQAFNRYLRRGDDDGLVDLQRKAMSAGVGPEGAFAVPTILSDQIVKVLREQSVMRQIARVMPMGSGGALELLIDKGAAGAASWVSETGSRAATTSPEVAKLRLEPHELYAQPEITQTLLDDSVIDLESWIAEKIAVAFSEAESSAFTVGDGVGKPRGIATYPTAATADSTRAWGTFEHVKSGANGGFAASVPADRLIQLTYKLKSGYRPNASWLMSRSTAAEIRQFKESTTNAYIWQPSLQGSEPDNLLGFPVHFSEDLPVLATGSLSLWFGDFSRGYVVVDRRPYTLLRDPFTNKPYVRFYVTARVAGGVADFNALKAMQFSA